MSCVAIRHYRRLRLEPAVAVVALLLVFQTLFGSLSASAQDNSASPFYKFTVVAKSERDLQAFPGFLLPDDPRGVSINDRDWIVFRGRGLAFTTGRSGFLAKPSEIGFDLTPLGLSFIGPRSLQINNQNYAIADSPSLNGDPLFVENLNDRTVQNVAISGGLSSINNKNQVAFITRNQSGSLQVATPQQTGGLNQALVDFDLASGTEIPRPAITDDGSVLIRAGNKPDSPIKLYSNDLTTSVETIASTPDFTSLGLNPGASDDGQIVVFYGENADGPGIFASIKAGASRVIQRIAGNTINSPLLAFEPNSPVSVNSTQADEPFVDALGTGVYSGESFTDKNSNGRFDPGQRAVTVAYVAFDLRGKKAIYTTRLNFFGNGVNNFNAKLPGAFSVGPPTLVAEQGQSIPGLEGQVQDLQIEDSLNNRDRGDLAFWVQTDSLQAGIPLTAIIRARPQQVVYLDFNPVKNFKLDPLAASLFKELGVGCGSCWAGTMAEVFATLAPGRGDLNGDSNSETIQNGIVDLVQQAFTDRNINVKVLGRKFLLTDEPPPVEGAFIHVFIGDGPNSQSNPGDGTVGISPLDLFNRGETIDIGSFAVAKGAATVLQKTPLIFVDNMFRIADITGDGVEDGFFTCPPPGLPECGPTGSPVSLNQASGSGTIQTVEVERAVASTIAHEVGHALGLSHLPTGLNDLIMNAKYENDELRLAQRFSDRGIMVDLGVAHQNDRNRLAFAVGSDVDPPGQDNPGGGGVPRDPPSRSVLSNDDRLNFRVFAPSGAASINVVRAVLGIVPFGGSDSMPELVDLGAGDLGALLTRTIQVGTLDKIFVVASTTGNGIDIFSVARGFAATADSIDVSNALSVLTETRIRSSVFDALGEPQQNLFQLIQMTSSGVVLLGGLGSDSGGGPNLESIKLTPLNPSIAIGGTQQFTARGKFTDGSTQDLTTRVGWSSSNEGAATIDATGLATALAGGTTTIEAAIGDLRANTTLTVAGIVARTERVSVSSDNAQADNDSNFGVSISADGRFVAFVSYADNLVSGDNNGTPDVFVHDSALSTTERVSISTTGAEADAARSLNRVIGSSNPLISADGRFVAFDSAATNLVSNDTNCYGDVFVHDRQTGLTERVDVSSTSAQASLGSTCNPETPTFSTGASISADGRFVAFISDADNLVPNSGQGFPPQFFAYVRDRQNGTTEQISPAGEAAISGNGRFVAFSSTTCGPGSFFRGTIVICLRDRSRGTNELISVSSAGDVADGSSGNPAISADGRFVAFVSPASNLVPNVANGILQVFVRDRVTGVTERVSISETGDQITGILGGNQVNFHSRFPSISNDGRIVAFVSGSTAYVRDRIAGKTEVVSVSMTGKPRDGVELSRSPVGVSADGRLVAFQSFANDLVPNDTNGHSDIFVRDRGMATAPSDHAPPATAAAIAPAPNAAGWNNSDVTVTLLAADDLGGSGVKQITYSAVGAQPLASTNFVGSSTSIVITAEGLTTISFFATDQASNLETAKTLVIRVDKTPPTITGTHTPSANANGWNNTNVTVSFACSDSLSGPAAGSPPSDTTLSNEGAGQSVTKSCQDLAGNSAFATVSNINIDKTPPVITGSRTPLPNSAGWNNSNVTVNFACSDSLSGIATCGLASQLVTSEGTNQSRSAIAVDLAGNTASATVNGISIDKTPPALACSATPSVLWPPDHKLVSASTAVKVTDSLSGSAGFLLQSATSNEPDDGLGDGDTANDIQGWDIGTPDISGWLRAERSGLGSGRVYTLIYQGTDKAGNAANCTSFVTVPHDKSGGQ